MITVYGDLMLDVWTHVEALKVSQEAPVLVVRKSSTTYSPGGAGNVAVNCAHLGVDVKMLGVVGADNDGDILTQALIDAKVALGCKVDEGAKTVCKQRIVDSSGQHLLRIDDESPLPCLKELDLSGLKGPKDTLVISDYAKGTCCQDAVVKAIECARRRECTIIVNGKPEHLAWYQGASMVIFNEAEASAVSPDAVNHPHKILALLEGTVPYCVVTRGAQGMIWAHRSSRLIHFVDAPEVAVADVAGAGDTVVATLAVLGLSDVQRMLEQAAINAAQVVAQRGTSLP